MRTVIIAIGNELLNGKIHDYNSYWITKRLTNLGFEVKRIFIIPDEIEAILETLEWCQKNGVKLVITTGGLGPTPGDLTLDAIAKFIGKKLVLSEEAVKYVKKRYEELYRLGYVTSPELNENRLKMAKVPEGSRLIYNDVGVAPGVITQKDDMTILSMPGVPSEMMYILEKALPLLPKPAKRKIYITETKVHLGDESLLADIFKEIMSLYPKLRIKSYPEGFGENVAMRIILEYEDGEKSEAERAFNSALEILNKKVRELMGG